MTQTTGRLPKGSEPGKAIDRWVELSPGIATENDLGMGAALAPEGAATCLVQSFAVLVGTSERSIGSPVRSTAAGSGCSRSSSARRRCFVLIWRACSAVATVSARGRTDRAPALNCAGLLFLVATVGLKSAMLIPIAASACWSRARAAARAVSRSTPRSMAISGSWSTPRRGNCSRRAPAGEPLVAAPPIGGE